MMESLEFRIMVSYSQIAVFDRALERPFNDWTRGHVAQGFSWRPGSVGFRTIAEGGQHLVTVRIDANEGEPSQEAVRVIDVPFEVPPGGAVEIASISDGVPLELPSGIYQLRFECYERTNSPSPRIRLLFNPDKNPSFRIVRADSELNPGVDLLRIASPA
jgi:hypothetical protein